VLDDLLDKLLDEPSPFFLGLLNINTRPIPRYSGHSLSEQMRNYVNNGKGQSLRGTRDMPAHTQEKRRQYRCI